MQPQVILITGASSGFGKITAQMLSEQGHIVYGTSRKPSGNMNNVKMLVADVTNILSIHEAVGQIISEQGRIDVLINNAGMGIGGALELATEDEISGQMNTNFFGVVNMCKVVLPYIVEPGDFNTGFTDNRNISEATRVNTDYKESFLKSLEIIEKEERNGCHPKKLGHAICKIVARKNPPFRTKVGPWIQVTFAKSKKWLPDVVMQYALRIFYAIQ